MSSLTYSIIFGETPPAGRDWAGVVPFFKIQPDANPSIARLSLFQRHKIWIVTCNLIRDARGKGLVYMRRKWTSWDWLIFIGSWWPPRSTLIVMHVHMSRARKTQSSEISPKDRNNKSGSIKLRRFALQLEYGNFKTHFCPVLELRERENDKQKLV